MSKIQSKKRKKLLIDIILAVVIVAMGIFIYYRVNQMRIDQEENADNSSSDSLKNLVEGGDTPSDTPQDDQDNKARAAFDFNLDSLDGDSISLSDFVGTPVMVNFWATWCPPCREEMPLIQEYAAAHQGDFVVLAVNAGEEQALVESFVTSNSFTDLIFLIDSENSVATMYQIPGFPTSLFIDTEGMLQAAHIGVLDRDVFIQYLAQLGLE